MSGRNISPLFHFLKIKTFCRRRIFMPSSSFKHEYVNSNDTTLSRFFLNLEDDYVSRINSKIESGSKQDLEQLKSDAFLVALVGDTPIVLMTTQREMVDAIMKLRKYYGTLINRDIVECMIEIQLCYTPCILCSTQKDFWNRIDKVIAEGIAEK